MIFSFYLFSLTVSAFLFAYVGAHLCKQGLPYLGMIDEPNARSNHKEPVIRGGGLAVMVSALSFLYIAGLDAHLLLIASGIAAISFMDDKQGLPFQHRLLVQIVGVGVLFIPGGVADSLFKGLVFQGLLPAYLDSVLAALFMLGFMNIYNFMDGIDGITGVETISVGVGVALLAMVGESIFQLGIDGVVIASAIAGFLLLNWHPAKLFLGDVGSVPLGFLLGFLLLQLAAAGYWQASLLLPAYYMVDGGLTLLNRLGKGEKIWEAHSQHAYQQAVRKRYPHDYVALCIAKLNGVLIALSIVAVAFPEYALYALMVGYVAAIWKFIYFHRLPFKAEVQLPAEQQQVAG